MVFSALTREKNGGVIGLFRQGALESKRIVSIHDLDPEKSYEVKQMDGKVITSASGKVLRDKGFEVELLNKYNGNLFEVCIK